MSSLSGSQSVIVLGLGIAGSSIAATLAERGYRVTAIEQFSPLHDRGSSHGDSRIFRRVPHEGPVYVDMATQSLEGWLRWNQLSGKPLYVATGGIDAGPADSAMVLSAEELCLEYEQPFELVSGATWSRQHPTFRLPADWRVVYQEASGVVWPDGTRTFLHAQARSHGARLLHNTRVIAIEPGPAAVTVRTANETLTADHLIVSAGSWLSKLLPELHLPLRTERRVLSWHQPASPLPADTPIFIFDADNGWYGMPTPDGRIKIGHDKHLAQAINPDNLTIEPTAEDAAFLAPCIRNYFTGVEPEPAAMKACIYTITPDHNFLFDRHPGHANILVISCCSGHGFKYAPVYGEIAADLLADKPRPELAAFSLNRSSARATRFARKAKAPQRNVRRQQGQAGVSTTIKSS
jgi:sarcosine oxidase